MLSLGLGPYLLRINLSPGPASTMIGAKFGSTVFFTIEHSASSDAVVKPVSLFFLSLWSVSFTKLQSLWAPLLEVLLQSLPLLARTISCGGGFGGADPLFLG